MHFHRALDHIADIRSQMAATLTFRGYRSVTTACTGIIAVVAAMVQQSWIGNGANSLYTYLVIWLIAALASIVVVASEIIWRFTRSPYPLQRELSLAAAEQFIPCIVAGALVTYAIPRSEYQVAWMLPSLWMILFALGAFASRRLLSRWIFLVGAYYLLLGVVTLRLPHSVQLSPWLMGGVFGLGQLIAAVILYLTLERSHAR